MRGGIITLGGVRTSRSGNGRRLNPVSCPFSAGRRDAGTWCDLDIPVVPIEVFFAAGRFGD